MKTSIAENGPYRGEGILKLKLMALMYMLFTRLLHNLATSLLLLPAAKIRTYKVTRLCIHRKR